VEGRPVADAQRVLERAIREDEAWAEESGWEPWDTEGVGLSAYGPPDPEWDVFGTKLGIYGHGEASHVSPVGPDRAYRGMPDDVALAAAVVDSLIWDDPEWVAAVAAWQDRVPPPITPSNDWQARLAARGWRDSQDVLDAARVTPQQADVLRLRVNRPEWDWRAIGGEVSPKPLSGQRALVQYEYAIDKLHKIVKEFEPIPSEGVV
jgi:hypothetical protein